MTGHDWERGAACATADPEAWFPGKGESATAAIRICHACPVREPCLDAALAEERGRSPDHRHGIRGGLAAQTRWRLQRDRDRTATPTT